MSAAGTAGRDRRLRADRRQAGRRAAAAGRGWSAPPTPCPSAPRRLCSRYGGARLRRHRRAARARARRRRSSRPRTTSSRRWPSRRSRAGAHVLVEKPAGLGTAADRAPDPGRRATPAGWSRSASTTAFTRRSRELAAEVHSGASRRADASARALRPRRPARIRPRVARPAGALGRRRADRSGHAPARPDALDRGAAPAPLARCCARTSGTRQVEDNAALILGAADDRRAPVGDAPRDLDGVEEHVLDRGLLPHRQAPGRRPGALLRDAAACASTACGPSSARRIWRSAPIPTRICPGRRSGSISPARSASGGPLLGGLDDAHYAWAPVEDAYASSPDYAEIRAQVVCDCAEAALCPLFGILVPPSADGSLAACPCESQPGRLPAWNASAVTYSTRRPSRRRRPRPGPASRHSKLLGDPGTSAELGRSVDDLNHLVLVNARRGRRQGCRSSAASPA